MTFPYANASTGEAARGEIRKLLQQFGCESVGFMDNFAKHELLLAFAYKGRNIELRASAEGWAQGFLKESPYNHRRKSSQEQWKQKALDQGMIAVNSILRDWVKGQITAIDTGILTFDHVFLPHMLATDGTPMIDYMKNVALIIEDKTTKS